MKAYLIGGGIGSLAAAVFMIRDARVRGEDICIIDEAEIWGGSLDAGATSDGIYTMRGGRMFEEHFVCTYDLLSEIPSYDDPRISARQDIFNYYQEASWRASTRLIDKSGKSLDVSTMGFNLRDRLELVRLTLTPEALLGDKRIDEVFGPHFFTTNFWYMWCSMFAFEPWHSAIEMKRYLLRFIHHFPTIADMTSIYHTRYSQYHSMVVPLERWLKARGVQFLNGTRVTDLGLKPGRLEVESIEFVKGGEKGRWQIRPDDLVIITNGSMTAASSVGSMTKPAELRRGSPGSSWELWSKLARERSGLGKPEKFIGNIDQSKWLSFTATTTEPLFKVWMEEFMKNEMGRGGLITFTDSNWLMTIYLHHNPVYPDQPQGSYIWWGYGLNPDARGNFIAKKMSDCTGEELAREALHYLHLEQDRIEVIMAKTKSIPCMMPYITSQFMPREVDDRPRVVPEGSVNLAFVGQYCEIPDDTVFTVEYSVRAAKMAVTGLLKLDKPVPPVYPSRYNPRVLWRALLKSL